MHMVNKHINPWLSQFYSKLKVNEIKNTYIKKHNTYYDCVLLTRLDLWYHIPIEFNKFTIEENCVYSGDGGWLDYNLYGKNNVIDIYCDLYNHITDIQKDIRTIPWMPPFFPKNREESSRQDISNGPEWISSLWTSLNNISHKHWHLQLMGRGGLLIEEKYLMI